MPAHYIMDKKDFDYNLPKESIAQEPASERTGSKLMVLHICNKKIEHRSFRDLSEYLNAGDALVFNNTKVIPARIRGTKKDGQKIEILLVREISRNAWDVLVRPRKKVSEGDVIYFQGKLTGRIRELNPVRSIVEFDSKDDLINILDEIGEMPLPPYIKRPYSVSDKSRYQTVYAEKEGAIAAPTAGLHFSNEFMRSLSAKGVETLPLTLHIGLGSFIPVREEDVTRHKMGAEHFTIPEDIYANILNRRKEGRRIVAVGTSTVRALETAFSIPGFKGGNAIAGIFIYPGFNFRVVDSMVTNFHMPMSTPLLLTCAFGGRELILKAYREAVEKGYRFLSYGDSMAIFS